MYVDLKSDVKKEIESLTERILYNYNEIKKFYIDYLKDPFRSNNFQKIKNLQNEIKELEQQEDNLKQFLEKTNGKIDLDDVFKDLS